jgi:hypothetical protein
MENLNVNLKEEFNKDSLKGLFSMPKAEDFDPKTFAWKSAVKKAFFGYLGATLVNGFLALLITLLLIAIFGWGYILSLPFLIIIFGLISLAGYIFYFIGVKEMKDVSVGTSWANATNQLFIGSILGLVAMVINVIPLMGWLASIVSIASFIFSLLAYNELRKMKSSIKLAQGANLLFVSSIVSLVGAVISIIFILIPIVGMVFQLLFGILTLILTFLGWKAISESEFNPA